jgi:hypothetical protein
MARCSTSRCQKDDRPRSAVEPDILHSPAVERAVDHYGQAFELRIPARHHPGVVEDRPGAIFLQLFVDLPDELLAFALVGGSRLFDKQRLQLLVAISGVITL